MFIASRKKKTTWKRMMPRKSKKKGKYYFTEEHEQAVIDYATTSDNQLRTKLYVEWLEPAFNEMVDKIVFTYKFNNLPNIDLLREECKVYLTTILDKYNPNRGSKAFSYFSVITKNWFIHKVKKNSQGLRREIDLDNMSKRHEEEYMTEQHAYVAEREEQEFWENLWTEIESWEVENMRPNERKVLYAVQELLQKRDSIEIFNKKAIYLYMREMTGLNTKQVVNNLNKLRKKYRNFKTKWDKGEI